MISSVPIFKQNGQLWLFRLKFHQKWILGLEFQKFKSVFGMSLSKIPCVPIFSKNGELAQQELLNYVRYFGPWGCCKELGGAWNVLGGDGWSWLKVDRAGWRWVYGLEKLQNYICLYLLGKNNKPLKKMMKRKSAWTDP